MNYLLDTNILILYSKGDAVSQSIEQRYQVFTGGHLLTTSIVCLGEIDAINKKSKIGKRRQTAIAKLLKPMTTIGIAYEEVVSAYGDIDAYSQGKLPNRGPFTARNMGKNDIWIAATAHVYELTLLTADRDFDHLAGTYLDVEYIDLSTIA